MRVSTFLLHIKNRKQKKKERQKKVSEGELISEEYECFGWDEECYDDCSKCEIRKECELKEGR